MCQNDLPSWRSGASKKKASSVSLLVAKWNVFKNKLSSVSTCALNNKKCVNPVSLNTAISFHACHHSAHLGPGDHKTLFHNWHCCFLHCFLGVKYFHKAKSRVQAYFAFDLSTSTEKSDQEDSMPIRETERKEKTSKFLLFAPISPSLHILAS